MTFLAVTIGAPGAGKTTWAEKRFTPTERVSLDAFRGMLTGDENNQTANAEALQMRRIVLGARLDRKLPTIVDATNTRQQYREELVSLAREHGMSTVAVVFDTPLAVCLERNAGRERHVPDDILTAMWWQVAGSTPPGAVPLFDMTIRVGLDQTKVWGRRPAEATSWACFR